MRLIIPGACGFVGANFLNWIFKSKRSISTFDEIILVDVLQYGRQIVDPKILAHKKISFIKNSIYKGAVLNKVIRKGDVVVHLAADENTFDKPQNRFSSNFGEYLRTLANKQIDKFIFVSTADVYGINNSNNLVETDVVKPTTIYSANKLACEAYLQAYYSMFKFPVTIFRPVTIYGPRQYPGWLIPRVITRASKNLTIQITGDGLVKRDWIYVDDACEVLLKATVSNNNETVGQVFNLGTGHENTVLEVTKYILSTLNKSTSLIKFTLPRPGEIPRQITRAIKAKRAFGWKPKTNFLTGLKKTIDWYKYNFDRQLE